MPCSSFSMMNYPVLQCWECCDFSSEDKSGGKDPIFPALFSMLISQVSASRYPPPSLAADGLSASLDSAWALEFPAFLLLSQRSGCPGQTLGNFWANLRKSRSSSCSYTPTCKHSGRQITTIHNKTKLLGFFVPLMKVIKLHAKSQRLGGMESRA